MEPKFDFLAILIGEETVFWELHKPERINCCNFIFVTLPIFLLTVCSLTPMFPPHLSISIIGIMVSVRLLDYGVEFYFYYYRYRYVGSRGENIKFKGGGGLIWFSDKYKPVNP
jgi:hypothetical protein